jgi:hypothetical protein
MEWSGYLNVALHVTPETWFPRAWYPQCAIWEKLVEVCKLRYEQDTRFPISVSFGFVLKFRILPCLLWGTASATQLSNKS